MATGHPSEQELREFRLGRLDEKIAGPLRIHIASCSTCLGRVGSTRIEEPSPAPERVPASARGMTTIENPRPKAAPAAVVLEVPDYEVIRRLGGGGMGVVYLARNTLMGRMEVLKVVAQHMTDNPKVLDRFLQEIQAAARLQHRNIVAAYSAIRSGTGLILAMEYVDGIDLEARVAARGPVPVTEACFYAFQAAQGLQHAHARGMVHRDIKPANLILGLKETKGVVKILDFGLAKVASEGPVDGGLTRQGLMLGTPDYMSPEQIRDARNADIRADIYSLGCTMYFLLSGGPPFRGASLYDILQAHHSNEAGALDLVRPDVPVELAALVSKMMAKAPEDRFPTPSAVAEALLPFFKPGSAQKPVASPIAAPSPVSARATVIEGAYDLAPAAPVARPARANATMIEGTIDVAPSTAPAVRGARRATTLIETGDLPAYPDLRSVPSRETSAEADRPLWLRPQVMAAAAGVVLILGVGLAYVLKPSGVERAPSVPATTGDRVVARPDRPAIPEATAKAVAVADLTAAHPAEPSRAATSVKAEEKPDPPAAPEPPSTPGSVARESAPAVEPAVVEPRREPGRKPITGPDGVARHDFRSVADDPDRYIGVRVVPPGYLQMSTTIYTDGKHVPGHGALIVADRNGVKLSDERGKSSLGLGIVLEESLAREFQGFLSSIKYHPTVKPDCKIVPTMEVRKLGPESPHRYLAVVVGLEVLTHQNGNKVVDGDIDGAFQIQRFGDSATQGPRGQDWYERLGGQKYRDAMKRKRDDYLKTAKYNKSKNAADALYNSFMNEGMRRLGQQDAQQKMQQRNLEKKFTGGR